LLNKYKEIAMKLKSSKLKVVYPTKDELKKALISVGVGLALSGCGAVNSAVNSKSNTQKQEQTKEDLPKKESVQEDIVPGQVTGGLPLPSKGAYAKDDTK
jgi:hypothetical protein